MPFTTDDEFGEVVRHAVEEAVNMLKECYGTPLSQPHKDSLDRTLLGYGRDLFKRRQSPATAEIELREDVEVTRTVLINRIFTLLVAQPAAQPKMAALLVIADLVGAEAVRDCEPLWVAARAGDWKRAAAILMGFDWGRYRAARTHSAIDSETVNLRIIEIAVAVAA